MAAAISNQLFESTLQGLRRDLNELRRVVVGVAETNRRIERNQEEIKSDLESMFKSELLGMRLHLEDAMGERLDAFLEAIRQELKGARDE